ncbi:MULTISPECIES: conjugal transfer protein TraD [Burkholderia]|uniref:conjugal transfer protein TraD n=1 Tax=Burkholderia TaxID=32008 RepID=UPI001ABA3496|nr:MULTISPECIES: conjugal transfer protein TraD [Burkholderia]
MNLSHDPNTDMATDPMTRAAQLRAQAAQLEAKARTQRRKADAHRKIVLGGLVIRAGLADLEPAVLLGALLTVAGAAAAPDRVERWRQAGEEALRAGGKDADGAGGQGSRSDGVAARP